MPWTNTTATDPGGTGGSMPGSTTPASGAKSTYARFSGLAPRRRARRSMNRRTKIVATLGPATSTAERITSLVNAGMDVARLNLSHGSHEEHREAYQHIRKASDETGRAVGVLLDLQGPKIRLGEFAGGRAELERGATFTITTNADEAKHGDARLASTTYPDLARDVRPGDALLIDDGLIRLEVVESDGVRVRTRVVEGGPVKDHKGINLPGAAVSAPAMSEKDRDRK